MREQRPESRERDVAKRKAIMGVARKVEAALDELDISLFEERLPPLLQILSTLSPNAREAVRRPGRIPVAWLRINNLKGNVREADRSKGDMADRLKEAPAILEEIRQEKRRLILDYSHEGRAAADRPFAVIEQILEGLGVKPSSVMVLTQNSVAKDIAETLSAQGERGVAVVTAHRHLAEIWKMTVAPRANFAIPEVGFAAAPIGPRPYRFISLNYTIRGARAVLVARLLERGEPGYMSFSTERSRSNKTVNKVMREVREISLPEKLHENVARVQRLFDEKVEGRTDLDAMSDPKQAIYQLPEEGLRQSELFLVTETEIGDARLSRFTEKTIKAIIAGIPFVIFGNKGTVAAMREIGFDVFDGIVDHGYDAIDDPRERFEAAWMEAARVLDSGPGLVDRHRARIEAANAANAVAFRDVLPRRWIERPLDEIAAWAANRPDRATETP